MIEKTMDYSIFKKRKENTEINTQNLRKLVSSIKTKNLLDLRPILVNHHMEVIDGQHRLEAAKILGVPIFYQIEEKIDIEDMVILNSAQRIWKIDDYINYYANSGNKTFQLLQEYCKQRKMSIATFCALSGIGGFNILRLKTNRIDLTELQRKMKELDVYLDVISTIQGFLYDKMLGSRKYIYGPKFARSLINISRLDGFKLETFFKKLNFNLSKVHSCAKVSDYDQMFLSIYNYKNQEPIVL